jgi:DUF1009 family protein
MSRTVLIAGAGALPAALVAAMAERPLICAVDGCAPEGVDPDQIFGIERLAIFLQWLEDQGVSRVCFAGAVKRPRLDPSLFDPATAQMVPRLIAAMKGGDDATLRAVLEIFSEAGFGVVGVHDLAPLLVPGPGLLAGKPGAQDEADAARAAGIVQALGAVDVGQGCVVAQGLCLAVEALPGTDAMLAGVAAIGDLRPDPAAGRGLLFKAAKPGQDLRIDLPTLGPQTLWAVAEAGLGGIAFQAGAVICLDLPQMQRIATERDLFLWAR